jgi:DNA mismatch repair protein MutL
VEQGDDLLIIDQHAAHERLLYDRFSSSQSSASQPLLTPAVLTVSHAQKLLIDENIDVFQSLGFDIEPFGTLEYKVSAVPMVVAGVPVAELINDALNEISENRGKEVLKRELIIRASCRSAIKAGDKLSQTELLSVAHSFLNTGMTPTCPHGRPVITVITKKQVEKSFKRVL